MTTTILPLLLLLLLLLLTTSTTTVVEAIGNQCWSYRVTPTGGGGCETACGMKCEGSGISPYDYYAMDCGADIFDTLGYEIDVTEPCNNGGGLFWNGGFPHHNLEQAAQLYTQLGDLGSSTGQGRPGTCSHFDSSTDDGGFDFDEFGRVHNAYLNYVRGKSHKALVKAMGVDVTDSAQRYKFGRTFVDSTGSFGPFSNHDRPPEVKEFATRCDTNNRIDAVLAGRYDARRHEPVNLSDGLTTFLDRAAKRIAAAANNDDYSFDRFIRYDIPELEAFVRSGGKGNKSKEGRDKSKGKGGRDRDEEETDMMTRTWTTGGGVGPIVIDLEKGTASDAAIMLAMLSTLKYSIRYWTALDSEDPEAEEDSTNALELKNNLRIIDTLNRCGESETDENCNRLRRLRLLEEQRRRLAFFGKIKRALKDFFAYVDFAVHSWNGDSFSWDHSDALDYAAQ